MNGLKLIIFILLLGSSLIGPSAFANAGEGVQLVQLSPEQAERLRELSSELRCLVCNAQSLAESNAPLAADLRRLISEHIAIGESDQQIRDFLIARYGQWISLRPLFSAATLILWLAPFVFLLIGFFYWFKRKR